MNIHQKLATRLFKAVIRTLNNEKVEFWLDHDSLLGVWSAKEGKDLSWQQDVFLSVKEENLNILQKALNNLSFLYRVSSSAGRSPKKWVRGNNIAYMITNRGKKRDFTFTVYIKIKYRQDGKFRWVDHRNSKHVDSSYYDNLESINFDGADYNIPSRTDDYLKLRYGNWKTLNKNWVHQINDGALAEAELLKQHPKNVLKKRVPQTIVKLADGKNMDRMKEMLLFTIDLLHKNNIPYWLEAGTLLGIYRDGELIPWDHDADISFPGEYYDKVKKVLGKKTFPKYYLRDKKVKPNNRDWLPGKVQNVKVKSAWAKPRNINFHVDMFCFYKVDDKYRWIGSSVLKHADAKFFDNLEEIEWEGRMVTVPAHTEEYLSLCYGNWKVPDKSYSAEKEDGAIAEGGL